MKSVICLKLEIGYLTLGKTAKISSLNKQRVRAVTLMNSCRLFAPKWSARISTFTLVLKELLKIKIMVKISMISKTLPNLLQNVMIYCLVGRFGQLQITELDMFIFFKLRENFKTSVLSRRNRNNFSNYHATFWFLALKHGGLGRWMDG